MINLIKINTNVLLTLFITITANNIMHGMQNNNLQQQRNMDMYLQQQMNHHPNQRVFGQGSPQMQTKVNIHNSKVPTKTKKHRK